LTLRAYQDGVATIKGDSKTSGYNVSFGEGKDPIFSQMNTYFFENITDFDK